MDHNCTKYVFNLFDNKTLPAHLEDAYENNKYQLILDELDKKGVSPKDIKNLLENLTISRGFLQLLNYLKPKNAEKIIVSDANSLFINWILEKNGLTYFDKIFTNPAQIQDGVIKTTHYHQHDCKFCPASMCKKTIVQSYLNEKQINYRKLIYIGDGSNDYCPLHLLKSNDIAFYRKGYGLDKKIMRDGHELLCEKKGWDNGEQIFEIIKKFI